MKSARAAPLASRPGCAEHLTGYQTKRQRKKKQKHYDPCDSAIGSQIFVSHNENGTPKDKSALTNVQRFLYIALYKRIHFKTHQNCEFATQQLGAQRLLIGVDIDDALFDSCVLFLICDDRDKSSKRCKSIQNKDNALYLQLFSQKMTTLTKYPQQLSSLLMRCNVLTWSVCLD